MSCRCSVTSKQPLLSIHLHFNHSWDVFRVLFFRESWNKMWWRQKERGKERGEQDEVQKEEKRKSPDSWAPLQGGGEEGGRTMASQRCDRTPKGSRVVYTHVCVCGNGQKCARLCVYVHEEGAGQEASINSRFSPTSRGHWACLRIQWGRRVSSSCRAELIIYRWLTLQCSSLMNLQVSETGYRKSLIVFLQVQSTQMYRY